MAKRTQRPGAARRRPAGLRPRAGRHRCAPRRTPHGRPSATGTASALHTDGTESGTFLAGGRVTRGAPAAHVNTHGLLNRMRVAASHCWRSALATSSRDGMTIAMPIEDRQHPRANLAAFRSHLRTTCDPPPSPWATRHSPVARHPPPPRRPRATGWPGARPGPRWRRAPWRPCGSR